MIITLTVVEQVSGTLNNTGHSVVFTLDSEHHTSAAAAGAAGDKAIMSVGSDPLKLGGIHHRRGLSGSSITRGLYDADGRPEKYTRSRRNRDNFLGDVKIYRQENNRLRSNLIKRDYGTKSRRETSTSRDPSGKMFKREINLQNTEITSTKKDTKLKYETYDKGTTRSVPVLNSFDKRTRFPNSSRKEILNANNIFHNIDTVSEERIKSNDLHQNLKRKGHTLKNLYQDGISIDEITSDSHNFLNASHVDVDIVIGDDGQDDGQVDGHDVPFQTGVGGDVMLSDDGNMFGGMQEEGRNRGPILNITGGPLSYRYQA